MYSDDEIQEIRYKILTNKDDLNKIILERINILLKESNLTQTKFFDEINIPQQRSNASSFFNGKNNSKITVQLLDRISERFKVSINWLIGILPESVRKDEYLDMQKYTGLTEENINLLHNLKRGDLAEQKILIEKSDYPKYQAYIDILNSMMDSKFFTIVLNDLRTIDLNLKNSNLKGIGYDISKDGKYVQLSHDMAKNFLVKNACSHFEDLIKDINNTKE